MKITVVAFTVAATSALSSASVAQSSTTDAPPANLAGKPPELTLSFTPSVRYQFDSGVGDAKSSVLRYAGEIGVFAPINDQLSTAVSLKFEQSRYSWTNLPGLSRELISRSATARFSPLHPRSPSTSIRHGHSPAARSSTSPQLMARIGFLSDLSRICICDVQAQRLTFAFNRHWRKHSPARRRARAATYRR